MLARFPVERKSGAKGATAAAYPMHNHRTRCSDRAARRSVDQVRERLDAEGTAASLMLPAQLKLILTAKNSVPERRPPASRTCGPEVRGPRKAAVLCRLSPASVSGTSRSTFIGIDWLTAA
jgi:hypothetical protein